jgi:hypothetical protein
MESWNPESLLIQIILKMLDFKDSIYNLLQHYNEFTNLPLTPQFGHVTDTALRMINAQMFDCRFLNEAVAFHDGGWLTGRGDHGELTPFSIRRSVLQSFTPYKLPHQFNEFTHHPASNPSIRAGHGR